MLLQLRSLRPLHPGSLFATKSLHFLLGLLAVCSARADFGPPHYTPYQFTTINTGSVPVKRANGMAIDSSGNLRIMTTKEFDDPGRLYTVTPVGTVTSTTVLTSIPYGLLLDADDNVYYVHVINSESSAVVRWKPDTPLFYYAWYPNAIAGYSLALDKAGNVYLAGAYDGAIRKFAPDGSAGIVFAGQPGSLGRIDGPAANARLTGISSMTTDKAGNLYVAEGTNTCIRKITLDGMVTTYAGRAPGFWDATVADAQFNTPGSIVFDPSGNLFVSETGNCTIRRISPEGNVTTIGGAPQQRGNADGIGGNARFGGSRMLLASDQSGAIYVADTLNNVVRKGVPVPVLTITQQPVSRTATVGGSVTFSVVASAASDLTYQWSFNGNDIPGATTASLTLPSVQMSAAGNYAVTVSGLGQVTISIQATLTVGAVPVAPVILTQPLDLSVGTGQAAGFSVAATGAGTLLYQWRKNGTDIPGATSASYNIVSVSASDSGSYYVVISGEGGAVQSSTAALTVTTGSPSRLANISTRAVVEQGSGVLIAGFIIQGTQPKQVLIRASGPALVKFGVGGFLADPRLELHDNRSMLATNDDWCDQADNKAVIAAASARSGAFAWDENSRDAAIVATLSPGLYTAIVRSGSSTSGVALVEVYEMDAANTGARLVNISSRSAVKSGVGVQIAGFIIAGNRPKKVLIRASGPALTKYGVAGVLVDPILELHDSSRVIDANDNWSPSLLNEFKRLGIDNWEQNSTDAALEITLSPGTYTAILAGKNETTGVALIEVFEADQ